MNWFVLCVQLNIIRSTKCIKVNDEVWQKFSHFCLVALACLFFVLFCKNGSFSKSHFLSQHTLKKVLCSELNVQKIFKKCLNWIMPTVFNVLSFESSGGTAVTWNMFLSYYSSNSWNVERIPKRILKQRINSLVVIF